MQQFYVVKEVLNEKLRRGYEFTVDNGYLEQKINDRLQEVAASVRMDGFRKGKVSLELVRRSYGGGVIKEVLSQVIDDTSSKFMKEGAFGDIVTSEIKVTAYPKACSTNGEGGDLIYELEFELMPECPPINPEEIVLEELEAEVGQEDIDTFIEDLKARYSNFVAAEPGLCAAPGHKVVVDYHSTFKGKALRKGRMQGFTTVLGKGNVLEGFENQVIGMKEGEEKVFNLEFPSDYGAQPFAGKEVEMSVKLVSIMVPEVVNNREELAKGCGFKSVEDMVNFATESLRKQFAYMSSALMRKELFDHMEKTYQTQAPESVVSQEVARIKRELSGDELASMSEEDILKEAERRVLLGMMLIRVSRDYNVVIESRDVLAFVQSNYPSYGPNLNAVLKRIRSDKEMRDHIRGRVLEDKVVTYMIAKAKKEKRSVPAEDLKSLFKGI
ncbi:MAG: trigger factor [Anaplasma sp.]